MGYKIRESCADDEALITNSWLESYKRTSTFAKNLRASIYFEHHEKIIKSLLKSTSAKVFVAHADDDPFVILGYIVAEQTPTCDIIHFCYVKSAFRGFKISRALFEHLNFDDSKLVFTHWTSAMNGLVYKFPSIAYNPYLFLGAKS